MFWCKLFLLVDNYTEMILYILAALTGGSMA